MGCNNEPEENCAFSLETCDFTILWSIEGGVNECEIIVRNIGDSHLETIWFDLYLYADNKINEIMQEIEVVTELGTNQIMSKLINFDINSSNLPITEYTVENKRAFCK